MRRELWNQLKICQDVSRSWFNRIVRKVSIYFTWLFLHTRITANQVSVLGLLSGMLAGLLFSLGEPLPMLIGAIAINLVLIFDHVDGEIARYRKQTSIEGAYLDDLCYGIATIMIVLGFSYGVSQTIDKIWISYLGFSFLVFYLGHRYIENGIYHTAFVRNRRAKEKGEYLSGTILLTSSFTDQPAINQPENFFVKCFLWMFGLFPQCGKFYRFGAVYITISAACIFDWLISLTNFSNFIISMRLVSVTFYGLLLPVSFFLRLRKIIVTKAISKWFEIDTSKKRSRIDQKGGKN